MLLRYFAFLTLAMNLLAEDNMLVSTQWLSDHASDPKLVLLHVGSQTDYDAGHIAGAQLLTLADISITDSRGMLLQLPETDVLRTAFSAKGIAPESRVVLYSGNNSVQSATRVWFTLDYLGLSKQASLLDGGLGLWRSEGRPTVTEGVTARAKGSVAGAPRPNVVAVAEQVRDPKFELIDARTPEFYTGANPGRMPRGGHIPGARNVPFSSLLNEDGKFKPKSELQKLIGAGTKPVLSYCHIGQQATVVYFVARYLGRDAVLYDGSFQDYSARPELPVETVK